METFPRGTKRELAMRAKHRVEQYTTTTKVVPYADHSLEAKGPIERHSTIQTG